MAKLTKNIYTVCFENNGDSKVLYSAGTFFNVYEDKIEILNPNSDLKALEYALENFNVSSEGLYFYYDLRSKSVSKITESVNSIDFQEEQRNASIEAFNKIEEIQSKINDVNELITEHRSAGKITEVNEAKVIVSELKSQISAIKPAASHVLYRYVAESNKLFINNREVAMDSLTEGAFASGLIEYAHKPILSKFEFAAKNFNAFNTAENVVEITEEGVTTTVIKANEKAFIYRNNKEAKITKLDELSAIGTIDYIAETTGEDISDLFTEVIESQNSLKVKIDARLQETYEMVAFLKDQRNVLADANKNIPEIKEADSLINSEILKLEHVAQVLESDELTKSDGYTRATLRRDSDDLVQGTEVSVDALDYTTSSSDDLVTISHNGELRKIAKNLVDLSPRDSI